MTEKRFTCHQMITDYSTGEDLDFDFLQELIDKQEQPKDLRMHISDGNKIITYRECVDWLNELNDENEQLKKGMIGVVDKYIKNVECNPPSSTRTYIKIKKTIINIREDLRDLISDLK